MAKKKFIFPIFLYMLVSCSTLTKQLIDYGEFSIKGGVYKNQKWNDSLTFKRVSWFHEFSMFFDVNVVRFNNKGPFANWLSPDEVAEISGCRDFLISLTYSLDEDKISQRMFLDEMVRNGYDKIMLPNFEIHLKLHPDFDRSSLSLYKLYGHCKRTDSEIVQSISVGFPGFSESIIKLD